MKKDEYIICPCCKREYQRYRQMDGYCIRCYIRNEPMIIRKKKILKIKNNLDKK
jgi:hypothetical protein